ncbi:MAG: hypothetical protein A2513_05370 [Sulfurimonas sp. RIFOXYD12_FULL_33_39]|uniref:carbamoyltransferase C-terminal domain-containing protein n=1 Tax=unclassified Sulfurimonas TaxID=2623549 RepID=UPI0008C61FBB|nr:MULTISPECIES: carbamoyltransferase C-terminal domain-containing protein [unclassified Sulfurimonas]OHE10301.1 MAG: hypothetical protein A2513_05370 [Sulfurimonas sp. RIFOXYD12_FULL_33_39]OHE13123.1 MAG: hypothetical protein A2530_11585 [Sulfurimonas sp. RIFOXYD2_FULL_34_21]DAB28567.1 MAG TPA: hypothetical protein CFH78_01750 [Sulfurimonas sp. UBA10385]
MYIVGISCAGESGAALFKNSELICAANEERFSRIKLDTAFPINALEWCLSYANIDKEKIDRVVYGFSSGCEIQEEKINWISELLAIDISTKAGVIKHERVITETTVDQKNYEEFLSNIKVFFLRDIPITRVNHHMSHIASAYIPSCMREAIVVTADGRGDYSSVTIGIASPDGYRGLYAAPSWSSFGYFYGRMTKLCGFTPNRHEGKVTGLAAFGDYTKALSFVQKMIYIENGKVVTNLGDYYKPFFTNYSDLLEEEAREFSREDLASATQYHLENMVTELISFYAKKTNIKNIALAGGVFSNISLNQAIYNIDKEFDVFVYPNMGDAGICVGGCYAWLWSEKRISSKKIDSMYLGYKIDSQNILNQLKAYDCTAYKPDDIYATVVEMLKEGKTVGVVQGQAEFGPRALGNRSILASPQNGNIIKRINKQLGRDIFMPLAPVMMLDLASEFVEFKDKNSFDKGYFMTMTFNAKPKLKEVAQAVIHVDETVRPQFVTLDSNEFVYNLLKAWYIETGCPALINTSFNSHEEPIINDEKDTLSSLAKGVVDVVVSPPYIVQKISKS